MEKKIWHSCRNETDSVYSAKYGNKIKDSYVFLLFLSAILWLAHGGRRDGLKRHKGGRNKQKRERKKIEREHETKKNMERDKSILLYLHFFSRSLSSPSSYRNNSNNNNVNVNRSF